MSIEDPDEPSPSPINPITLKHTLRLASRVRIRNCSKSADIGIKEYPNALLPNNIDAAFSGTSVKSFSFSTTPIKILSSIHSEFEHSNKSFKIINSDLVNYSENINVENSKYDKNHPKQPIQVNTFVRNRSDKGKIQAVNDKKETIHKNRVGISSTPIPTDKSFSYSKWIQKETITNFINKYIPKFLIPAFRAIKKLKIKFAIPKRKGENAYIKDLKAIKKNKPAMKKRNNRQITIST